MDLPNPYTGNYRLLMIFPIVVVLASLAVILFISPIRQGIDFHGGIDIDVQSLQPVDVSSLRDALARGGYSVNSIESKPNPGGHDTKISLERADKMVDADALKTSFFAQTRLTERAESDALFRNTTATWDTFGAERARLNLLAGQLFNLTGYSGPAPSEYNTTHALAKAASAAFSGFSDAENARLRAIISGKIPGSSASFTEVTASLASDFLSKALMVVIYSVLLTTIVVFLIFRTLVPSLAVLTGAAADIVIALGAMGLFGIPLTLASFAALLMLVGFSLDTDILLSIRVIKRREGHASERAYEAMKTGMTMSVSLLVALSALFVLAYLTHISVYYEISSVALAGLVGDLVATWCFNAVIILHHAEEEEKKGGTASARSLASYLFKN